MFACFGLSLVTFHNFLFWTTQFSVWIPQLILTRVLKLYSEYSLLQLWQIS